MAGDVIRLVTAPEEKIRHHYLHRHLLLGFNGRVQFFSDGCDTQLSAGKGCFLPPGHSYYLQGVLPNRLLTINVDINEGRRGKKEKEILQRMFLQPTAFSIDQTFCERISDWVVETQDSTYSVQKSIHLRSILIYSLYERIFDPAAIEQGSQERFSLEKIDKYIQTHLHEKIQVAEMADLCHLSVSRFYSRFRQATGQSPYQYVLKKRVERAEHLLRATDLPIYDIAVQSGFFSQSALNAAIKKEYRTSPSKLRSR